MTVAAVILAAGASSRFGRNKLLLPFGGQCVIQRTVSNVLASAVTRVVVVTGHDAGAIAEALADAAAPRVLRVLNADYQDGEMLSSIKVGLHALEPTDARAALIVPGDQPLLRPELIDRLLLAYTQRCGAIIAPRFEGQRGHPVLFDRSVWDEILALPSDGNPRDVLRAHQHDLAHIAVSDDSILVDVDTPEAYRTARLRAGLPD